LYLDLYLLSALLTFVGGALSFYFYGVYSKIFSFDQILIPSFCKLTKEDCISIIDTKYGRIFGYSNALVGTVFLFFHTAALIATSFNIIHYHLPLFMSFVSLLIGAYLIYGLIKLNVKCNICISVHLINFIVFVLQISILIK